MSESYIYNGIWLNWSQGPVLGWTLTLKSREAQLLTAFLAVFVSTAGTQAWKITSYLLHQLRAARIPGDGRHQQAQVILRNTTSSLGASWELFNLGWPWRKVASSGFWRILILVTIGVLHASGWAVASIFSSRTTQSTGAEVLVRSPDCGYYDHQTKDLVYNDQFLASKNSNFTNDAVQYVRQCYGDTGHNPLYCDQYTVPEISWKKNLNATCPFDAEVCKLNDTAAAIEMDTGVLSSLSAFGINTPISESVGYRKVTTCAPMRTPTGFFELVNNTSVNGSAGTDLWLRFYFGPTIGGSVGSEYNWTYEYKLADAGAGTGYTLTTQYAPAQYFSEAWIPAPQVNRTDADVSLFFLVLGDVSYNEPVDDPLFSAHYPFSVGNSTAYSSDRYVSLLGCTDQYSICNLNPKAGNQSCSPLGGKIALLTAIDTNVVGLSVLQRAIAYIIYLNGGDKSIYDAVAGASSLQASSTLWQNIQLPLPNNQWQIEVSTWFNVALAKLQANIPQFASGPPAPFAGSVITPPFSDIDRSICYSQKVRQGQGYASFSLLGVVIILAVGGAIILTSLFIDTVVGFIQRRLRRGAYKAVQWRLDEKLSLQRMLYEKADIGQWQNCDGKVPITTTKVSNMGVVIEGENGKHPTYGREWAGGVAEPFLGQNRFDEQVEGKGRYTSVVFEESMGAE